jgi:hypothetical protein
MSIKIEKHAVEPARNGQRTDFREFCVALTTLKPGESFLFAMSTYHRNALSALQHGLGRRFSARRAANGLFRVGRLQ